jgi:hypothetical protein
MHNRVLRRLLFLVVALLPISGPAQTSKETSAELAQQLVRLLRYDKQMEAYRENCVNTAKSVSPESLVKENPHKFGGVTPASRHWPKIVEAYEQYYREFCARPTVEEFLAAMAAVYARDMSVPDLRAAIRLYSTPSGQRLTESHRNTSAVISTLVREANAVEVPKALVNLDRRIDEIALEEEEDKRKCPPSRSMRSNNAMDSDTYSAQLRALISARHRGRYAARSGGVE